MEGSLVLTHTQRFVVVVVVTVVVGSLLIVIVFAKNTICITVYRLQKKVLRLARKPMGFFFSFNVRSFGSSRSSG